MPYRKSFLRVLAALLALALLAGCSAAAPNAPTEEPAVPTEATEATPDPEPEASAAPQLGQRDVHVSTVDELLAAIAPNTTIWLDKGDYDLTAAENYGKTPDGVSYTWEQIGQPGDYGLVIMDAENLILRGEEPAETRILTDPRYVNVLRFIDCEAPGLEALTVGHTEGAYCSGGVLRFDRCDRVTIGNCGLFGCGTVGIMARDCEEINVINSRIYECSSSAVSVTGCRDVLVEGCDIYDHGKRWEGSNARSLFEAIDTEGFVIYNSRLADSDVWYLFDCVRSRNAFFLSNEVSGNLVNLAMFHFEQYPCVVDGCVFDDNESSAWVPAHALGPVGPDGQPLDGEALESMSLHDCDPGMPFPAIALGETAAEIEPGGTVSVSSVDEFLSAIGPDRTILLEGELFDLSEASSYGKAGSEYYRWAECYDGPKLVIENLSGLSIVAPLGDAPAVVISAAPRYADVLSFVNCSDLILEGFTAGHTAEPGTCAGGVLHFDGCHHVQINRCRLFGCGILGIQTADCSDLTLTRTEIYECSQGAGEFYKTDGIVFTDCNIHDVPSPQFRYRACGDIECNGEAVSGGDRFDIGSDGRPEAWAAPDGEN